MSVLYLINSVGTVGNGRFSSQPMMTVKRNEIANIFKKLLIVVDYHVGSIENKVSVWVVHHKFECMLTALKTVL